VSAVAGMSFQPRLTGESFHALPSTCIGHPRVRSRHDALSVILSTDHSTSP